MAAIPHLDKLAGLLEDKDSDVRAAAAGAGAPELAIYSWDGFGIGWNDLGTVLDSLWMLRYVFELFWDDVWVV